MKYFSEKGKEIIQHPGCQSRMYFEGETTPCTGYCAMFNSFYNEEYIEPYGVHDDNEGFFVVSGTGRMVIGEEEFELNPGVTMIAPAHTPHAIKKTSSDDLEIFLFHFPA